MVRSAGAEEAQRGGAQRFLFWFGLAKPNPASTSCRNAAACLQPCHGLQSRAKAFLALLGCPTTEQASASRAAEPPTKRVED